MAHAPQTWPRAWHSKPPARVPSLPHFAHVRTGLGLRSRRNRGAGAVKKSFGFSGAIEGAAAVTGAVDSAAGSAGAGAAAAGAGATAKGVGDAAAAGAAAGTASGGTAAGSGAAAAGAAGLWLGRTSALQPCVAAGPVQAAGSASAVGWDARLASPDASQAATELAAVGAGSGSNVSVNGRALFKAEIAGNQSSWVTSALISFPLI